MGRLAKASFTFLALMGMAVFGGCSDDDSATGPEESTPTEEESSAVSSVLGDGFLGSPMLTLELSGALLDATPQVTGKRTVSPLASLAGQDDIIIDLIGSYSYTNGWHVFDFSATVVDHQTDDTVDVAGIDSVQVLVDGQPVQQVNDSTPSEELRARAHLDWDLRSGQVSADANHALDVGVTPEGSDTLVTISGSVNDTIVGVEIGDTVTCDVDVALNQVIDSLQMYASTQDGECPENGYISSTAHLELNCQGSGAGVNSARINGTWTVTAEVNDDGSVTFTYDGPILHWTATEPCDQTAVAKARWWAGR